MTTLRVISLGAGVQSTAVALMAAHGEITPMPDCGIFADTGWEPPAVYSHLEWLKGQLPFPVYTVSAGNIRDDVMAGASKRAGRFAAVPWFTVNPDGSKGMGRRQCTAHYKLEPIRRKIRELLDAPRYIKPGTVEMWIGISTDEASRMKPSRVRYVTNRWPLIEGGISRRDCERALLGRFAVVAPKSACECCPFHSNAMWREVRTRPAAWQALLDADAAIRNGGSSKGIRGQQFMHASRVPLDQVDLSTAEERGQGNLFENECEGMCGT